MDLLAKLAVEVASFRNGRWPSLCPVTPLTLLEATYVNDK